MGAYPNTYVGIYLTYPQQKTIRHEKVWVHPTTGKQKKWRFNPETGEEMEQKTIEVVDKWWPSGYIDDVEGLDEDTFFGQYNDGHYVYFMLNGDSEFAFTMDECESRAITTSDLNDDMFVRFQRKYRKYLDYFKEKYGQYEMHYGVINYLW